MNNFFTENNILDFELTTREVLNTILNKLKL